MSGEKISDLEIKTLKLGDVSLVDNFNHIFRKLVKCSFCGCETMNQAVGDGCHACSRGVMKAKGES